MGKDVNSSKRVKSWLEGKLAFQYWKGKEKVQIFWAKVLSVKKFIDNGMRVPEGTVTRFNQSINCH